MNPWDERYSQPGFYYGTSPNDFLKEQFQKIRSGGSVLYLAEGEGRNAVFLAKLGFRVTAVDQSIVGLKKLEALAHEHGVRVQTVLADLNDYRIQPDSWDGIVSIWCHVPQPLRTRLHASVVQGLKKGGAFILEAYHPRQIEFKTGGPPDPNLMMTLVDLKKELKGLKLEIAQEIERDVQEGTGHFGKSAVTQILGFHHQ